MSQKLLTYLQLGLGMATFGSATPVSKIVTEAMPPFVGSVFRVALGGLILVPFAWSHRSQLGQMRGREWLLTLLIALFGMVGFTAFMLYGMALVSGVVGAIVMSTAPAVTAAASMLFVGDKPTWRKIVAIVLAVAGVLILHLGRARGSADAGDHFLLGSLLVFAAVCCEAAFTLLGKQAAERVEPVLIGCLAALIAIPLFVPLAIWQWPSFSIQGVDTRGWVALVWYGAGTLALGTWLWYSGVKQAEGAVAAGFMGVMPASALILSYVLLGEAFRWLHILGFTVVAASVVLISWEHARLAREAKHPEN